MIKNMNSLNVKEIEAYRIISIKYGMDEYELYDALYHYMKTYCNGHKMESYLFKDEVENLIGIRDHDEILEYIISNIKI